MSMWRKGHSEEEAVEATRQILSGTREKAVNEAEYQAAREAQAKRAAKVEANRAALGAPPGWGDGKAFRRLHPEEVEAVATYWRNKYASYGDPEIARLGEKKLAAALKADGYEVPPRVEPDRLQLLLKRAAKGNN